MLRVILLFIISVLSTQTWGYTFPQIRDYDTQTCHFVDRTAEFAEQKFCYDDKLNFQEPVYFSQVTVSQEKALSKSFLAFVDDLFATKSATKIGVSGGKGAGKGFSNKIKDQARAESRDTCVFCGTKTTRQPGSTRSEIDHAIPKSRNGNNSLENAQNTCRTCNRQKGAKTTDEFLQ